MFWRSSGIRITAAVMTLFILASVAIIGAIHWQTSRILTERDVSGLIAETRSLSTIAAREGTAELLLTLRRRAADPAMFYGLADANGRPQWLGGLARWPETLEQDNTTAVFEYVRQTPMRENAGRANGMAIGATLRLPDGGRLLVARDVTEHRELADAIRTWFWAGLLLLAALAILAGWAINRLLLARMEAMTETAQGIMAGDLEKRIPVTKSHDEFDALAENLNAMLDRIASLLHGLREVSDNIAHDLKTPLNRLRNRAEEALRDPRGDAACREGLEATLVEADELIRTFNALLRVARLEAGTLSENLETFDAVALVRDLAEFYEPVAEEANATMAVEASGSLLLRADRQLISQALTNLIENALKYGLHADLPAARRALVIGAEASASGAALWVSDRGRGIVVADRERVLKRFVRLDAARSEPGTGLGLSLVAAVMRQHGGQVELQDNAPGLKVILRLSQERLAANVVSSSQTAIEPVESRQPNHKAITADP